MPHEDAPLHERAKQSDYGLYLLGASLPEGLRTPIWKISLLINELDSLVNSTTEEMIGHIRLAWWREHIDAILSDADMTPAHPTLIELVDVIPQIKPAIWEQFFDKYAHKLNTPTEHTETLFQSPSLHLIEALTTETPISENIKTLWVAGELAISKVTPHLHYRYDMALPESEEKEGKLAHVIYDFFPNCINRKEKDIKYNKIERLCLAIATDRIQRLKRSKGNMNHHNMMRPSVFLPFKLWCCARKP